MLQLKLLNTVGISLNGAEPGFTRLSGKKALGSLPVTVMTLWHYRNTPPPGVSAVAVAAAGCTLAPTLTSLYDVMQVYYAN